MFLDNNDNATTPTTHHHRRANPKTTHGTTSHTTTTAAAHIANTNTNIEATATTYTNDTTTTDTIGGVIYRIKALRVRLVVIIRTHNSIQSQRSRRTIASFMLRHIMCILFLVVGDGVVVDCAAIDADIRAVNNQHINKNTNDTHDIIRNCDNTLSTRVTPFPTTTTMYDVPTQVHNCTTGNDFNNDAVG